MRAWRYSSISNGLEHSMKLETDVPVPSQDLTKDDILIKVHAASLNPADYKLAELPSFVLKRLVNIPATPCMDFSGVVVAAGPDVTDFKVGQKVFGRSDPFLGGGLGEYLRAPLRKLGLAVLPESVSFEDGAAVGTAGQTAYQLIAPYVREGDRVLVNGGSGGTGTFGIQVAKALGCSVTATCSGRNAELCRSLGADRIIDYTQEDVSGVLKAEGQAAFSLVFDTVGYSPVNLYAAANDFLKPDGRFVQIGGELSLRSVKAMLTRFLTPGFLGGGKRKLETPLTHNSAEDLSQLGSWIAGGKVKVVVDGVFSFEQASEAFASLKKGRARGKIIVKVSE
jgi:NADPH:quinone reductase-like Zn-dependent oxidoreductase